MLVNSFAKAYLTKCNATCRTPYFQEQTRQAAAAAAVALVPIQQEADGRASRRFLYSLFYLFEKDSFVHSFDLFSRLPACLPIRLLAIQFFCFVFRSFSFFCVRLRLRVRQRI